ncbi:hypothetical protein Tco_1544847 [Tanacetum coccineum]
MSDSKHSTVTYTSISSNYEEPSNVGSLRVVVYGYDRLLMHPPSPDYVPGPKHPPSPVYVPYFPEPACPEFMPPKDDVFPAEEQPLLVVVAPTADSPGYITEFDPKEDLEEEDDEDPEEDPTDYPMDRDDEEEEEESSGDDADDEEKDEGEDEEEAEEHLAPVDSVPPPQTGTCRARMTVLPQPFMEASTKAMIAAVAAILPLPSPPPSPLTSCSSPLPQILSPPLPVSSSLPISPPPLSTSPTDAGAPLGYIAAMIRASMVLMRATAPSSYILAPRSGILPSGTPPSGTPPLLPITLPTSSPPLILPSTDCRADVTEVMLPPQKRLCIALGPRFKVEE